MKLLILALALVSASAFAKKEYAKVNVNWDATGRWALFENLVMMCDDTYYDGIDLTVQGNYKNTQGKIVIEKFIDFTDCPDGISITKRENTSLRGKSAVKIRFDINGDRCDMKVKKEKSDKFFTLEISDAC